MTALSVLGLAVLTFGSWGSSETARLTLTLSMLLFSMLWALARHVGAALLEQADEIAALRRALAESRSTK